MGRNRSHRRRFRGARDADARRTTALRSLITAAAVARCLAAPRRVLAICIKGTEYAEIGGGFVVVDRWSDAPFPSTNPNRAEFLGVVRRRHLETDLHKNCRQRHLVHLRLDAYWSKGSRASMRYCVSERFTAAGVGRWFFRLTPCPQAGALRDWLHKLGLRPFDGPRYITLARPAAALPPHPTRLRVRAVPPAELRAWQMFLLQLYGEYAGIYLTTIGRDDCTHFLAFDGDRPVAAAGLCVTGTTSTVRHLDNARGGVHGGCLVRWRLEEIHRDTSGVSRRLVGPISVCGGGGNDNE